MTNTAADKPPPTPPVRRGGAGAGERRASRRAGPAPRPAGGGRGPGRPRRPDPAVQPARPDARAVRTLAATQRYGGPASLVYVDLDGLKAINDRFGHSAGDAALRAVAARLIGHVRASDVAGRMGGDEFAVILAQTNGFQAEAKARALAAAIAAEPVEGLPPVVRLGSPGAWPRSAPTPSRTPSSPRPTRPCTRPGGRAG